MRTQLALALVVAFAPVALAQEPDPPKCTITKVNGTATSLEVSGVWAKGERWADYNCRSDGEKAVIKWANENKACEGKTLSVKWTTAMGKKGAEKTWESTILCSKVLKAAGTAPTTTPPAADKPATTTTPPASGGGKSEFDSTGWQKLGERSVAGKYDKDTIFVGKYKGTFSKLSLVVLDSDLELLDLEVKFDKGKSFRPALRHTFKEGSRSRVIDLPGDDRVIKSIVLRYKNIAGGGSAKAQIWAK